MDGDAVEDDHERIRKDKMEDKVPCNLGPACGLNPPGDCDDDCRMVLFKPIRMIQFSLLVGLVLIFLLMHYCSKFSEWIITPLRQTGGTYFMMIVGPFFVVTLTDLLSQYCNEDPIPDTPMFLFGVCGVMFFFGIFYITIIDFLYSLKFAPMYILSFLLSLAFGIDVIMIVVYGYYN